jgi:hypothetical protein
VCQRQLFGSLPEIIHDNVITASSAEYPTHAPKQTAIQGHTWCAEVCAFEIFVIGNQIPALHLKLEMEKYFTIISSQHINIKDNVHIKVLEKASNHLTFGKLPAPAANQIAGNQKISLGMHK